MMMELEPGDAYVSIWPLVLLAVVVAVALVAVALVALVAA